MRASTGMLGQADVGPRLRAFGGSSVPPRSLRLSVKKLPEWGNAVVQYTSELPWTHARARPRLPTSAIVRCITESILYRLSIAVIGWRAGMIPAAEAEATFLLPRTELTVHQIHAPISLHTCS